MEQIPRTPYELIFMVITTIAAAVLAVDRFILQRRKNISELDQETHKARTELVDHLKDTVEFLEKEVKDLKIKVQEQGEVIKRLGTENEVMTKVFQGRDDSTKEFQEKGMEVLTKFDDIEKVIIETANLAKSNSELIHLANGNIEKLARAIEKHLARIEKNTG